VLVVCCGVAPGVNEGAHFHFDAPDETLRLFTISIEVRTESAELAPRQWAEAWSFCDPGHQPSTDPSGGPFHPLRGLVR
jgi:hypothetical protein